MLKLSANVVIPEKEIEITAIRSQGAGGQNVNKVASAIHLRFDIRASSLPLVYKQRLLALHDQRISKDGIVVIKAQEYRSRGKNKAQAMHRLREIIRGAMIRNKKRKPTKPSRSARMKRVDDKIRRGKIKSLRGKVN